MISLGGRQPLRVLVVHNFRDRRWPSGENRQVDMEVDALRARGVTVEMLAIENAVAKASAGASARAAVGGLLPRRWSGVLPDSATFDLAHVHNVDPQWGLGIARAIRSAGRPVIRSVHNWAPVCPNGLRFRDGMVCNDCAFSTLPTPAITHRCSTTSVRSTLEATRLVARRMARSHEVPELTLAMSPSHFKRLGELGFEGRLALHANTVDVGDTDPTPLPRRHRQVAFLGRMTQQKGFDLYAQLAREHRGAARFVACGEGPLGHLTGSSVDPLGNLSSEQAAHVMGESQIVVIPSRGEETFGRVAAEAAAAGAWVIAFDHGGLGDLLRAGLPGHSVALGDGLRGLAGALAESLATISGLDDTGAQEIRQRQRVALAPYSPKATAERLLGYYQQVLDEAASPP